MSLAPGRAALRHLVILVGNFGSALRCQYRYSIALKQNKNSDSALSCPMARVSRFTVAFALLCCVWLIGSLALWDPGSDSDSAASYHRRANHWREQATDTTAFAKLESPVLAAPVRPDSRPISSALSAALDEFVTRHYFSHATISNSGRYLIFHVGDDGLGNKLLPLVSAFLLALLMDRTFLLHWTGSEAINNSPMHVDQLFTQPAGMLWGFQEAALHTIERKSQFGAAATVSDATRAQLGALFRQPRSVKVEHTRQFLTAFGVDFRDIDFRSADYGMVKEDAMCRNWIAEYANVSALVMYGDQYFVPCLQANAHYQQRMHAWFEGAPDIFGPLARWLLRPSAEVAAYLGNFTAAHYAPYTIGMQMRRRERLGLKDPEVESALRCARELAAAHRKTHGARAPVAFFVASDEAPFRVRLRGRLADVGPVAFTPEFAVREDPEKGLFFAVIDFFLLSRCADIISTPSSTYGYISHAYSSIIPHRVRLMPNDGWMRPASSEPSSHFWQPLMREAKNMCIDKKRFEFLMGQEECCPRWS